MKLGVQIIIYVLLVIFINESCMRVSTKTSTAANNISRVQNLCVHLLHPKGDIIPCSHIMHPGGDPSNEMIFLPTNIYKSIYPNQSNNSSQIPKMKSCTHKLHTEHLQPCNHLIHPNGD